MPSPASSTARFPEMRALRTSDAAPARCVSTSRAPTAWWWAPISRAHRSRSAPPQPRDSVSSACSLSRPTCVSPASSAAPLTSFTRRASFGKLVELVRPGGVIVLGVYNAIARIPTRLRRAVARVSGYRVVPFDPILRDRSHDPERREAWLRDQYRHPEEHRHTIADVQRWFAEHGVEYLRTYPSAVFDDTPEDLFTRAADNWGLESWLTQIAWMRTLGREGGLFLTIGRKEESSPLSRAAGVAQGKPRMGRSRSD